MSSFKESEHEEFQQKEAILNFVQKNMTSAAVVIEDLDAFKAWLTKTLTPMLVLLFRVWF